MKDVFIRILKWVFKGVPITKIYASVYQLSPSERLKKKKVLITGGGRGLGFYMAKKFIAEGALVVITGRNEDVLKKASLELNNCPYISFDVRRFDTYRNVIQRADELLGGGLNSLVNNAGISLHEHSFEDVTLENFDDQFDTNIKGPYFLSQTFIKYAKEKGVTGLNIIFITSERGMYCDVLPYGLTKATINSLTAGLSRYYVTKNIRVNAIAPGVTASDMTRFNKEGDLYREKSCGKRVFIPEEIAEVTAFVLSDESACITGQIVPCNHGNHLRSDY